MANVVVDARGYDLVSARITGGTRRARLEALEEGRQAAVRACPVSEGEPHGDVHLYETIRVVGVNQYADDLVAGDPSKGVSHAAPVEYGTYKMRGYHYMAAAAQHIANVFPQKVVKHIR
jgi:hypothetical protein